MSCWLLPSAQGACGASCRCPAATRLGGAAARPSPTPTRRARQDRRLPGRRAVHRPVAGGVLGPAGPPLGARGDAAAAAVLEAPLPARLREPVRRGRRLDRLAAVRPY